MYNSEPTFFIKEKYVLDDARKIFIEKKFDLIPIVDKDHQVIDILIWEDNNGEPGNVIHTESLSMQEIEDNQTVPGNPNAFYSTIVKLSSPLLIQGDFYVGIEVSGADPAGEEAAIAYTHDFNFDNSGRPGSSWLYITSSNPWGVTAGWKNIETFLNGSPKYAMHIYARTTSLPVSSQISASSQNVCQGDIVNFDASIKPSGTLGSSATLL